MYIPLLGQCSSGLYRGSVKPPPPALRDNITIPTASHTIRVENKSYLRRGLTEADIAEIVKLVASDGAANDEYGYSVAMDGNILVIGAYRKDSNKGKGSDGLCLRVHPLTLCATGAVYVYATFDGGQSYVEAAKLLASDGAGDDEFGTSVSVHNDTIVVGAHWDDNSAGMNAGEGRDQRVYGLSEWIINYAPCKLSVYMQSVYMSICVVLSVYNLRPLGVLTRSLFCLLCLRVI